LAHSVDDRPKVEAFALQIVARILDEPGLPYGQVKLDPSRHRPGDLRTVRAIAVGSLIGCKDFDPSIRSERTC
jgi:hypothetical protein